MVSSPALPWPSLRPCHSDASSTSGRSVRRRSCTRPSLSARWRSWRRFSRRGRRRCLSPMVAIRNEPTTMWLLARERVGLAIRGMAEEDSTSTAIGPLIAEVADSVRRAESFPEATRVALESLREWAGAQSVVLLESSGDEYRCEELSIPARGFLLNRLTHYPHPVAITDQDFDAWLRWARKFRPRHVAEIERLRQSGVRMAVPLRTKTDLIGVLLLGAPGARERYTSSDKAPAAKLGGCVCAPDRERAPDDARRRAGEAAQGRRARGRGSEASAPGQRRHRVTIATLAAFTLPRAVRRRRLLRFP